jgi:hypothetical protein
MHSRRQFLKKLAYLIGASGLVAKSQAHEMIPKQTNSDTVSTLYRAVNGSPAENLSKAIELAGGVEKFIGRDDIVVIKPNVQWWNQGAPNLSAVKRFVESVFGRPSGFKGEVVLAENCHRGRQPWKKGASGWTRPFDRNSDLDGAGNYNDLCALLKKKFGDRFSICHWINVDAGGKRVWNPADGTGYVYCDGSGGVPAVKFDNGVNGDGFRSVIMSYPIFQTDRGSKVDLKHGVWEKKAYTSRPVKFINFAALNHHSTYCGFTSCIKNYLGVSDLSGGPDPHHGGRLADSYYNFHSFPFDKWAPGPQPGMIGAEIGVYLSTIRRADLNIVTAEWVGLSSRTDAPVARTKAVLAGSDPVALDFHCAKYILHPNSGIKYHRSDAPESPAYQYLKACSEHGGGVFDERKVEIRSWDFEKGRFQGDDELVILGEKEWGSNPKAILKYLVFRYGFSLPLSCINNMAKGR